MNPISLDAIKAARQTIAGSAIRTPLVRLNHEYGSARIFLKLENLQPIGSFKLRGAANALATAGKTSIESGVVTASAGNMAQGVAWSAKRLNLACRVIVPDHAPANKLEAIQRLGGTIDKVSFDDWWQVIETHQPNRPGFFVHPVCDPAVIAGNGTIGLEILEDLPDVDCILVPFGGGGLSTGIASAVRALKPDTRIYACEVETAAPLKAALSADAPQQIEYRPSFVDGIGSTQVLPRMWPLVRKLIDDSLVVSLDQIADTIRLMLERNRIVAEGAGAAAVAAALNHHIDAKNIVCIVSGGNIDSAKIAKILSGEIP